MKKKVFAIIGIVMLMVALLPSSNARAYTALYKGLYVNVAHTGLRAIISTGTGTGSPPPFSFSAISPDTYDQDWFFAISPSYSCVESGTRLHRAPGGSTTRTFYVYNACVGGYPVSTSLSDSTFRSKYVRQNTWNDTGTAFTDENYELRVVKTSSTPTWSVYLYNYNTSAYDLITSINGSNGADNGGFTFQDVGATQQEGSYCPTLYPWGIMQARGIQYLSGSTWTTLGNTVSYYNSSEYCFTNNQYMITTPNYYKWKMLTYGVSY